MGRPTQDYLAWFGYGTAEFWQAVRANRFLLGELVCQYVAKVGAINPTEPTCAALAGAIVAVQFGARAATLGDHELDSIYLGVKASACMRTLCTSRAVTTAFLSSAVTTAVYAVTTDLSSSAVTAAFLASAVTTASFANVA